MLWSGSGTGVTAHMGGHSQRKIIGMRVLSMHTLSAVNHVVHDAVVGVGRSKLSALEMHEGCKTSWGEVSSRQGGCAILPTTISSSFPPTLWAARTSEVLANAEGLGWVAGK
eukprot:878640-Pelagomonas_calceolata.AAC.4